MFSIVASLHTQETCPALLQGHWCLLPSLYLKNTFTGRHLPAWVSFLKHHSCINCPSAADLTTDLQWLQDGILLLGLRNCLIVCAQIWHWQIKKGLSLVLPDQLMLVQLCELFGDFCLNEGTCLRYSFVKSEGICFHWL